MGVFKSFKNIFQTNLYTIIKFSLPWLIILRILQFLFKKRGECKLFFNYPLRPQMTYHFPVAVLGCLLRVSIILGNHRK